MVERRSFLKSTSLVMGAFPLAGYLDHFIPDSGFDFILEIYATNWGFKGSMEEFCRKASEEGYDGIEIWVPSDDIKKRSLQEILEKYNLKLGLLCGNKGTTFDQHISSFKNALLSAVDLKPEFINCHSGKDFFDKKQNSQFLEYSFDVAESSGIPIYHETHRGRMLFSAPATESYIDRFEQLQLTLDISHWCCVHESLLDDQEIAVNKALSRVGHIHSRVGFQEAPQIPNVDDPQYADAVKAHFTWWDAVVKKKAENGEKLTMTTEFGPPPYMWTQPYDAQPLAACWDTNVAMKKLWMERYGKKH